MKILITTDLYTTETNGVSVSVRMLASELKALGEDVRILTLSQNRRSYTENAVYYIGSFSLEKVYPNVRGTLHLHSALLDKLIEWKPDVIHSQCEFFTYSFAKRIARRTGAPIVHTYHTLYEQYSHYVIRNEALGHYLVRKLVKWRLRSASEVIAPTKKAADILTGYQIDKPIRIVPTGLDLSRFHKRLTPERRAQLQAQYGIENSDFVLLYIGRLGAEKSIGDLLTLLSCALTKQPRLKLLLVGDGPDRKRLEKEAACLDIQDHVIFTGMVTPEEVAEYYQLGDVFVSASTSETQGLTYVEAAASKLPLVCVEDSCLDEILDSGVNGMAFDTIDEFVDAVLRLRVDPAFRYKAGVCSRAMAEKFDKRAFAEAAEAVYASARKTQDVHGGCEI
jgi:1,2-diacylglycerol 3-alpha-glucosyltransferase